MLENLEATYDDLDDLGKHQVEMFHDAVGEVTVRLEKMVREMRRCAERVSVQSLGDQPFVAMDDRDLLPDFVGAASGILRAYQGGVGNLWLSRVAATGHDAHEAFRRAARAKAAGAADV